MDVQEREDPRDPSVDVFQQGAQERRGELHPVLLHEGRVVCVLTDCLSVCLIGALIDEL